MAKRLPRPRHLRVNLPSDLLTELLSELSGRVIRQPACILRFGIWFRDARRWTRRIGWCLLAQPVSAVGPAVRRLFGWNGTDREISDLRHRLLLLLRTRKPYRRSVAGNEKPTLRTSRLLSGNRPSRCRPAGSIGGRRSSWRLVTSAIRPGDRCVR